MDNIDLLEHGGAGDHNPATVRHLDYDWPLDDPREHHYQWVLLALAVGHIPSIPSGIPEWKRAMAFDRWCAAWDLPSFNEARRLAYLVDHYRGAISHDLAVTLGQDLGALWRARRWRFLLDIIDRLPSHSWTNAALSMDEEHAEMMAKSIIERRLAGEEPESAKGPALTTWTPEMAMLTNLLDATRGVQHAIIAVNSDPKKAKPEPPKPSPRPITPLERTLKRLEFERKKAKHESLVARVLPHKAQK